MIIAGSIFTASCIGIIVLLGVKRLEEARGRVLVAPSQRAKLDERALRLKRSLLSASGEVGELPARSVVLGRRLLRLAALGAARLAEALEERAYAFADRFSHKHRFERRETNSDFLRSVGEHPMRARDAMEDREEVRDAA